MAQNLSFIPSFTTLRGTFAAAALVVASASSWALPTFSIDPTAVGLNGEALTGDNFIISDFSTVLVSGNKFTEQGFLAVRAIELEGDVVEAFGPRSTYGLYFAFNATGTMSSATTGHFDTLSYTLYGYNGTQAKFGFSGNTTTVSKTGTVLATGTLVSGAVTNANTGGTSGQAIATLLSAQSPGFFTEPTPFHSTAQTSFSNTPSEMTAIAGGFQIRQGGGSVNFASAVPEPETYALLLAGLAAVGFVAKRRQA